VHHRGVTENEFEICSTDSQQGGSDRKVRPAGEADQSVAWEMPAALTPLQSASDGNETVPAGRADAQRLDEIRVLLAEFDDARPDEYTSLFFENGFWELHLAVRDLLRIFDRWGEPNRTELRTAPASRHQRPQLSGYETGRRWNELVGPFYTRAALQEMFDGAVPWTDLLVTETADGEKLFPAFQFDDRGVVDHLPDVLQLLRPSLDDWSAALWLNSPTTVWDGRSAIQMLKEGNWETVMMHAKHDAARRAL
jgi:hypothetical protein